MTKFIIIALVILAVVTLVACVSSNNVLNEIKTFRHSFSEYRGWLYECFCCL